MRPVGQKTKLNYEAQRQMVREADPRRYRRHIPTSSDIDPAPLSKKPKDTLCKFCGMPAVATHVVGTDACLRCATIHQDKIDVTQTLIYKLMKKNVTGK